MAGGNVHAGGAAIDHRFSRAASQRLHDDLALIPRVGGLLDREQHGLSTRQHLRSLYHLAGGGRDDDLGCTAVRGHTQDALWLTEQDAFLAPAQAEQRFDLADRHRRAARDREPLDRGIPDRGERHRLPIRRKDRVQDRTWLFAAGDCARLVAGHGPQVQASVGDVDDVRAIRRQRDDRAPNVRELLALGQRQRESHDGTRRLRLQCPCSEAGGECGEHRRPNGNRQRAPRCRR